jgi:hypothetical protein
MLGSVSADLAPMLRALMKTNPSQGIPRHRSLVNVFARDITSAPELYPARSWEIQLVLIVHQIIKPFHRKRNALFHYFKRAIDNSNLLFKPQPCGKIQKQ